MTRPSCVQCTERAISLDSDAVQLTFVEGQGTVGVIRFWKSGAKNDTSTVLGTNI
jgi:chitodextrinase